LNGRAAIKTGDL